MAVKISELPSLASASLNTYESVVPVVANTGVENVTYNTTVANVKIYVEQGDFNATGNISAGNLAVTNAATFSTITTTGSSEIGANLVVLGNLVVSGNVDYVGVNNVITSDNILELHVANTANISEPWTFDDGKDIGIRFHYYGSQNENAALVLSHDERYLEWYDSGSLGTDTFTGNSYGTFKTGGAIFVNATPTTGNATGTLQSHGGASVTGNLWVGGLGTIVGNITSSNLILTSANIISGTATFGGNLNFLKGNIVNGKMILTDVTGGVYSTGNVFTSARMSAGNLGVNTFATVGTTLVTGGNTTVQALTVNASATVGTTLGVTGNINGTSGATISGSATIGSTLGVTGIIRGASIQNTPIGTTTEAAGKFTTLITTDTVNLGGFTQVTGNVNPTANATYDLGSLDVRWANIYASGTVTANATFALYADLAEKYIPDQYYDPGTVVVFGGEQEITVTDQQGDTRVAGAISTQPAYVMNDGEENGVPVALRGKIPVKVVGSVNKGDLLITSNVSGYATAAKFNKPEPHAVFAKSLVRDDNDGPRVIWAVIL